MHATFIARIAYDACRAHAETQGDCSRKAWLELDSWQRAAVIEQVRAIAARPDADAAALHATFVRERCDRGWTIGAFFDRERKTDPLLVPWAQVPRFNRQQDALVLSITHALSQEYV